MGKTIERLAGSMKSALLIKSKSIIRGNGYIFELRFSEFDRRFYQTQKDAHKDFADINFMATLGPANAKREA